MQNWVIDFLRISRRDKETVSDTSFEEEVRQPIFAWRRLTDFFNHNFSTNHRMKELIGSTISDLHFEAFQKLVGANPYFLFADRFGSVQQVGPIDKTTLVLFAREILSLDFFTGRGVVIHEICHICAGHTECGVMGDESRRQWESEADSLACQWGFELEIQKIQSYIKNLKGE